MPKEVKAIIDLEKHAGKLISHADIKAFLLSYGTQASLAMSKGPVPLSLHNINQQAPPLPYSAILATGQATYSDEDRVNFLCTPEGADYAVSHQDDAKVRQHIFARAESLAEAKDMEGARSLTKAAEKAFRENVGHVMRQGTQWQSVRRNQQTVARTPAKAESPRRVKERANGAARAP